MYTRSLNCGFQLWPVPQLWPVSRPSHQFDRRSPNGRETYIQCQRQGRETSTKREIQSTFRIRGTRASGSSGHPRKWVIRNPIQRGFTIVELAVAVAMIATLLALVAEMIVFARVARRTVQQQAAVQQTADNLLERIISLPWEAIQTDADFTESLPDAFNDSPAGLSWEVVVVEETDPVPAKRITVRVTRPARNGRAQPPVRLTAWINKPPGDSS